jgi:tetratricopeptide (TPR) repeat protein
LPSTQARAQDAFLEEATVRDPAYVEPRTLLVKRLLAALEVPVSPPAGRRPQTTADEGRCAGADAERCARVVVAQSAALERLLPDSAEPVIWRARAFMLTGRPAVAAQALSTECAQLSDKLGCLRTWLEAAASARKADMVARAVRELEVVGCAGPDHCASAYEAIADALDRAGDKKGGLDYYEKAARQRPTAERWQRAADAAAAIGDQLLAKGDVAGAIAYSERAARADPTVARWRRVAELKEPRESATSMPSGESER